MVVSKFSKISSKLVAKGAEKSNIVMPLVDRILSLASRLSSELNEKLCGTFLEFLIFGDVYKKDKKNTKDVEVYVESLGQSFGTNQLFKA